MERTANPRRLLTWAVLAVAGAGLAWLLWQWANDMAGVRREAPKVPAIIPLPPPPPPPPPEPPREPEPPVEEKIVEPQPVPEAEEVKPAEEAPDPAQDLAEPMQMDGDAQAGGDSFNVGAGKGGGMAGGGGGGWAAAPTASTWPTRSSACCATTPSCATWCSTCRPRSGSAPRARSPVSNCCAAAASRRWTPRCSPPCAAPAPSTSVRPPT